MPPKYGQKCHVICFFNKIVYESEPYNVYLEKHYVECLFILYIY